MLDETVPDFSNSRMRPQNSSQNVTEQGADGQN
jgi:hypothetical protein